MSEADVLKNTFSYIKKLQNLTLWDILKSLLHPKLENGFVKSIFWGGLFGQVPNSDRLTRGNYKMTFLFYSSFNAYGKVREYRRFPVCPTLCFPYCEHLTFTVVWQLITNIDTLV